MTTDYPSVDALLDDEHSWSGRPVVRTARLDDDTTVVVRGRSRWGYAAVVVRTDTHEPASTGTGFEGSWPATIALAAARLEQTIAERRIDAVSQSELTGENPPYLLHVAAAVMGDAEWTRAELRDELIARAVDVGVPPATIARLIGTGRDAVYRALERRNGRP